MEKFNHASGIAGHNCAGGNILGHYAARADHGAFTDGDTAKEGRTGADGCPVPNQSFDTLPVGIHLQATVGVRSPGKKIIRKGYAMADEDFILDRHSLANEGVAGNFAAPADLGPFLNFDKSPDLCLVTDFAAIEIDETEYSDVLPQPDCWSDLLVGQLGRRHAAAVPRGVI
jgi:hypothetical protein